MSGNPYMTAREELAGDRKAYITEYGEGEILRTTVSFRVNPGEYDPAFDHETRVRVEYRNGEAFEWSCGNEWATAYLAQFGMSVSRDGRFAFIQTWDRGLFCYHARSGEIAWRTKSRAGITSVFVNEGTLLVHQRERALQLLDIETGEVLKEKKPAKDWNFYGLDDQHIICRTSARAWEIIRAEDLETVEIIPSKRFPKEPWCIRRVWLEGDQLKAEAFRDNIDRENDEMVETVQCRYADRINCETVKE